MAKQVKKETPDDKEKEELKEQMETMDLMDAEVEAATVCGPDDEKDEKKK